MLFILKKTNKRLQRAANSILPLFVFYVGYKAIREGNIRIFNLRIQLEIDISR